MTTYRLHRPLIARPRGPWIGWGASLLVHAGILAWLLLALPKPPPAPPDVPRMRFVLLPPRPVVPVASVPAPASPARAAHAARSAPAAHATVARPAPVAAPAAAPATSAPVITAETPAPSDAASTPGSASPTAPAADAPAAPAFDMAAARKTARLIEKHRKDGLVALPKPDPPLQRDDRLERAIERAHRPDCKSAYSGLSLMAVIPLVKDTLTGTGCKW